MKKYRIVLLFLGLAIILFNMPVWDCPPLSPLNTKETTDSLVYTNTAYGFTLTFPASWRNRYVVTEHNDTVLIRHKLTVEQIGSNDDGYIGTLFRIYVYSPQSRWTEAGVPFDPATGRHTIGESANAWYALEFPTDVQCLDDKYAEDYRELERDTGWVEDGGFGVIGGNLLDLTKVGSFLTEDDIALTLDGKEIPFSARLMYRYDGNDIYFKASELGRILGIKVVEAFANEAGEGLDIAPSQSVATFHEGLISYQYQNDTYVYTAIANSDSGSEPELARKSLIIDSAYYISSRAIPFLYYTRVDLVDHGVRKVRGQVNFTSFSAEVERAQNVSASTGFTLNLNGRLRFDKYMLLGRYIVYKDNQTYVINRDGRACMGPINGTLSYAYYGYVATVPDESCGELHGLYSHSGEQILKPEYAAIHNVDFRKGLLLLSQGVGANRKLGAAMIQCQELKAMLPVEFDEVMTWSDQIQVGPPGYELYFDKYISVQKNGKWGAYNLKGQLVVPLIYEAFGQLLTIGDTSYCNLYFDRGRELITVKKNGKWGVINMKNEIIIPFQYDEIFTKTIGPDQTWYGKKGKLEIKLS